MAANGKWCRRWWNYVTCKIVARTKDVSTTTATSTAYARFVNVARKRIICAFFFGVWLFYIYIGILIATFATHQDEERCRFRASFVHSLCFCNQINPAIRHLIPHTKPSVVSYLISCFISSYSFHFIVSDGMLLLATFCFVPFHSPSHTHCRFHITRGVWRRRCTRVFRWMTLIQAAMSTLSKRNNIQPIEQQHYTLLLLLLVFRSIRVLWCACVRAAVCVAIFIRSSHSLFIRSRANFSFFSAFQLIFLTLFFFSFSPQLLVVHSLLYFCCCSWLQAIRLLWSFSPHRLIGCLIISKHILCWLR